MARIGSCETNGISGFLKAGDFLVRCTTASFSRKNAWWWLSSLLVSGRRKHLTNCDVTIFTVHHQKSIKKELFCTNSLSVTSVFVNMTCEQ